MTMAIQQAARTALECQDACNLSGVLASFKRNRSRSDLAGSPSSRQGHRMGKSTPNLRVVLE